MKKYIAPKIEVVKTNTTTHLLAGSLTISNTTTTNQWATEFELEEELLREENLDFYFE